ncbi:MAG: hypothetical protein JOZ32_20865 [Bryobacterales bacterium]|nr:hypothetical protein [Bryobacterales bacterium]
MTGQQLRAVITKFQGDHQLQLTGDLDRPTRKPFAIR